MGVKDFVMKFGVDISELVSGMTAATEKIQESAVQMKESLDTVKGAFNTLGEAALAFAAIMAGGKIFGDMINTTVKMNVEALSLGKQFGVSATQASVLSAALKNVFVTQEDFSLAGTKLEKQLKTNKAAFDAVGIATTDAAGHFLPLLDIMLNTNAYLATVKEGTDRGVESAKLYGKGFEGISGTMRITRESIADAAAEVDALNIVVSQESEAATQQYRSSVVGVHEVLEGVSNTIGQAIIPTLTELGNWFRSVGPEVVAGFRIALDGLKVIFGAVADSVRTLWTAFTDFVSIFADGIGRMFGGESLTAVQFFSNALRVIEVAFIALRAGIQITAAVISNEFEYLLDLVTSWATVVERAFHLDWAGVQSAWKAGNAKIEADEEAHFQKLVTISQKAAKDMNDAITGTMGAKAPSTPTAAPGGTATSSNSDAVKEKSLRDIQKAIKDLDKSYADLEKEHDNQIKLWEAEAAEFSKNAGARIAIIQKEVDSETVAYGAGSKQAIEAQKRLTQAQQQAAEQTRQMADFFIANQTKSLQVQIDNDEKAAQQKFANHLISAAQLEAIELNLEDRRTEIERKGIEDRKKLIDPSHDPVAYAKILAELEALETAHENKISQIKMQAAKADNKLQDTVYKQLETSFSSTISGMLKGTLTLSQAFRNMAKDMLDAIIDFLAKWAAQWLVTQIANMIASKVASTGVVGAKAAEAGASGTASFAGAPWPVDLGAPAFGAAMAAAAGSFGAAASAEGGFDIPSGMSGPTVKTHPREMILPEHLADAVRAMAASGKTGGGAMHLHVPAMDGHSVRRVMTRNARQTIKAMKQIHRDIKR